MDEGSFTVDEGEIFGNLGPNGAGKTTTVECVEGLRTPDSGAASVLGLDPRRDRTELRERRDRCVVRCSTPTMAPNAARLPSPHCANGWV